MSSDLIDLNSLLKSDSNKFLENLKNSYLNILDVGVNDNNKQEIKRSFDSLKSLSGIFELNEITSFIIQVETLLNKIINSKLPFLTNDILNDLFIVKEQIDKLFQNYWEKNKKTFDKKTIEENKHCLEMLSGHLTNYLNQTKEEHKHLESTQEAEPTILKKEIQKKGDSLIFTPYTLSILNVGGLQKELLENLESCKSVTLELSHVNEIDTAGIQLIKSIQNYCLAKDRVCHIKSISSLIEKKLEMLGVSL